VSIRKRVVSKVIKKWLYKYHFSYIFDPHVISLINFHHVMIKGTQNVTTTMSDYLGDISTKKITNTLFIYPCYILIFLNNYSTISYSINVLYLD